LGEPVRDADKLTPIEVCNRAFEPLFPIKSANRSASSWHRRHR
jgi:hypothetical protein